MTQPPRPQPSKADRNRLLRLGGALVLAVVVVVVAIVVSSGGGGDEAPSADGIQGAQQVASTLDGIPQDGLTLGRADAPVTMIEFVDPQCPFCRQYAVDEMPAFIKDYVRTGKVKVQLRTLHFIGDDSTKGALAIQGAAQQDKAWNLADVLFHNQGAENAGWLSDATLDAAMAAVPGLDAVAVKRYAGGDAAAGALASATTEAQRYAADSTPSFVLGRSGGDLELSSAEPTAEALGTAVDALLARGQGT